MASAFGGLRSIKLGYGWQTMLCGRARPLHRLVDNAKAGHLQRVEPDHEQLAVFLQ